MTARLIRRAYHRLLLPSGEVVCRPVVEFDLKGNVVGWHELKEEEPFTEWVGGEIHIKDSTSFKS